MDIKTQKITQLQEEFSRWEQLLAPLREDQRSARQSAEDRSVKDILAHLLTWQKLTIARVEAALAGRDPETVRVPGWPAGLNPEAEDVDQLNDWMYTMNRERSWDEVYWEWRSGFQHLIELAQTLPAQLVSSEEQFIPQVLQGTFEHHHIDHYPSLRESLGNKIS